MENQNWRAFSGSQQRKSNVFDLRLTTESTIEHDLRTHCSYLGRIDTERREIYAIWLILWMYPLGGLVWQLAVSMLPMMSVAVLLNHLFGWAMYYRLLPHAATPNLWCIVPSVISVIAVQPPVRFPANQVFDLYAEWEINRAEMSNVYLLYL